MSKIRVTADTNIFYYLGSGILKKSDIVSSEEDLWATPVNVLEIVAGIGLSDWLQRTQAAKAIIMYSDAMADNPERHFSKFLGATFDNTDEPWIDTCKALSAANSPEDLIKGVVDYGENVRRTVDFKLAQQLKNNHYKDFVKKMVSVCDDMVPGYKAAFHKNQQLPAMSKSTRDKFREAAQSRTARATIMLKALGSRFKLVTGSDPPFHHQAIVTEAIDALFAYVIVYLQYVCELLTSRSKPTPNDFGDLELFLYLQPHTFVATTEKKWWRIADAAGIGHRLRKVLVPSGIARTSL